MSIRFDHIKRKAVDEFMVRTSLQGIMGGDFYVTQENRKLVQHKTETSPVFLALWSATGEPPRDPLVVLEEWRRHGGRLIENWDVRMVGKLIELFPSCVPNHLRGRKMACDYDEKGNWAVEFL